MKKVKVEGEVVIKDHGSQYIDFYEREFELDDAVTDEGIARSVIRKTMIGNELRKSVPGYKRVRTMQVVGFEATAEKKQGGHLERVAVEAVKAGVMPENLDMYRDDAGKVRAIEGALEKAKARKGVKAKGTVADPEVVDEGYID